MFRNFIYYLRLLSILFFIIFVCLLLKIIFNCDFFGISFLVMCILFILINIYTLLSRKDIYKDLVSYNLISIALSFYLGIIVFRLYVGEGVSDLSLINYDYFKTNFIIVDLVILGIILNTLFLSFFDMKKDL